MVLLVDKFTKLYTKLENHYHHHHHHHHDDHQRLDEALSGFRSDILFSLNQFLENWNPIGSENLTLPWIQQALELIPSVNQAFAKLAVDIDYPMRKWEAPSVENYLDNTFHILNLLNSISSALSQLGQVRLSLSHALSLLENSPSLALHHLKVKNSVSAKDFHKPENTNKASSEEISVSLSGKERIIHQALVEIKSIGFWVCGILLSGLHGEATPYLEIRKLADGSANSSVNGLDSWVTQLVSGKGFVLEDVKGLNYAVASLAAAITNGEQQSDAAEELRRKLKVFGKALEDLGTRVDYIFSSTLTRRNQLLDTVRKQNQPWRQEQKIFNQTRKLYF